MSAQGSPFQIQFPIRSTGRRAANTAGGSAGGSPPRVTQVLALAIHFQDMIRRGDARDYADLARLGCLTRERMSQMMELVWLAPDIQQEILEFRQSVVKRFPISEVAARKIAGCLDWRRQREFWSKLKQDKQLD